ncbi:hypothetical protein ACQKMV_06520 [Lysinibacillus sp. NPDC094403]|uniref:hypothetical protein n=1 Tax=Lysinibacillus sp. NPDC094403 TaxID=3390581 RepID=UPI003D0632F8
MSHLTLSFLQEVEEELKSNNFLVEDFNINTEDHLECVVLHIQYIYLPKFKFKGVIHKDKDRYVAEFSPGTITFTVSRDCPQKQTFLNMISEWIDNTHIEMSKTPITRQFKKT